MFWIFIARWHICFIKSSFNSMEGWKSASDTIGEVPGSVVNERFVPFPYGDGDRIRWPLNSTILCPFLRWNQWRRGNGGPISVNEDLQGLAHWYPIKSVPYHPIPDLFQSGTKIVPEHIKTRTRKSFDQPDAVDNSHYVPVFNSGSTSNDNSLSAVPSVLRDSKHHKTSRNLQQQLLWFPRSLFL